MRTIQFYIDFWGRAEIVGAMIPGARVDDIFSEWEKYTKQFICFTVRIC